MIYSAKNPFCIFLKQVFKGLGQIMLQENYVTGFLFLLGISYGSFNMGLAALLAAACGTLTARSLKYNNSEIDKGLYGFSAALTGVALVLFLKPILMTWIFIIIGSISATVIQHFFIKRNLPLFTLPFVLVTWLLLFLSHHFLPQVLHQLPESLVTDDNLYFFAIKGFGQVIFQDKLLCGTIFLIAVFINSPVAAFYGLTGAFLGGILAFCFSVPIQDIGVGLFSFNTVLCAIVFANKQIKEGLWALIAVLLSFIISLFMFHNNFIQLTFPFVAASYIVIRLKNTLA